MNVLEANFDGLVGPSHHYGGLAAGNLASTSHIGQVSNPKEAALQGLAKMKAMADLDVPQGVLPPQERPDFGLLRRLGFGDDAIDAVLARASQHPGLLSTASSAAAMWTANAATVVPSTDSSDGKVHFTPANLTANLHRSREHHTTGRALAHTFDHPDHFAHHAALPGTPALGDEGAANHTRFCATHGDPGIHFFVYGEGSRTFAPRQTRLASESVARLSKLPSERAVFAKQHPEAIDGGVFHNDVISVGNGPVLLYHDLAFADTAGTLAALQRAANFALIPVRVAADRVSLHAAIDSYLFNSQLITLPDGSMRLICAEHCRRTAAVWDEIQRILDDDNPISSVQTFELNQSMDNGGGPACLRLRVVLSETERAAVNADSWIDDPRYDALKSWVERHYRDRLHVADFADPAFTTEVRTALDELTQLLSLGAIYPFQRTEAR